jgi:hypothetical protein
MYVCLYVDVYYAQYICPQSECFKPAIALALANIQAEDGEPPPVCRQLVLDENSANFN